MKTPATQVFSARMTDLLLPILGDDWALYRRYSNSAQLGLTDKIQPGAFELRKDGKVIAWWNLTMLPGCCGVVVSTGAGVTRAWQKKGLGTALNLVRIEMARAMGYGLLLCTDLASN